MSKAPKVRTISAETLCSYTGLTDRQHRNIAKNGYFSPPYRGRYPEDATLKGMFKYLQEINRKKSDSAKAVEHRIKTAKAEMAEEELAVFREQYVLKKLIGPALRNVSLHQRAALQRKLEGEVGPNLAGKTTQEILARMRGAVDEICAVFQEGTRGWMDSCPEPAIEPVEHKPAESIVQQEKSAGLIHPTPK
jgi:hypothetical protein